MNCLFSSFFGISIASQYARCFCIEVYASTNAYTLDDQYVGSWSSGEVFLAQEHDVSEHNDLQTQLD